MAGNSRQAVLVGHCGPDSSYLRIAIQSAAPGTQVVPGGDEPSLQQALAQSPELLLINRQLDGAFAEELGVDLIRRLKLVHPQVKMMLVSNHADAQAAAVAAGAEPGFGKREIGTPRVAEILGAALR